MAVERQVEVGPPARDRQVPVAADRFRRFPEDIELSGQR